MSPPNLTDNAGAESRYRKPRADLYTVMLVIALLAILLAILFLYLHLRNYNFLATDNIPTGMVQVGSYFGTWASGLLG